MHGESVTVGVNGRVSDIIRTLDDTEFKLVLSLIDHLAEELEELTAEHPTSLSAIARVSPYAFVCRRETPTSHHWVVVEIFEDHDPEGLPPGGGGRLRGYATHNVMDSVFPPFPEELRKIIVQADEEDPLPIIYCGTPDNSNLAMKIYITDNINFRNISSVFSHSYFDYSNTRSTTNITLALNAADLTFAANNKTGGDMPAASHAAPTKTDVPEATREHDVQ